MSATIPAAHLATAGSGQITVSAGSLTSAPATFTVAAAPAIGSLSVSTATAGHTDLSVTITGTNFTSGSTVTWTFNSVTTTLSSAYSGATSMSATIPAADLSAQGPANIQVVSADGVPSATSAFTVAPAPAISGLSPSAATVNGTATLVTIAGSNFSNLSTVTWTAPGSSSPVLLSSSRYFGPTSMSAIVPATDLTTAGTAYIQVVSGDGVSSTPAPFTVNPSATISHLSPYYATVGRSAPFTLTVHGSGFVSGAKIAWNGTQQSSTQFVSATSLTCPISQSMIAAPGSVAVTVVNADSTTSAQGAFTIDAAPVVSSGNGLSPASIGAESGDTTVNIAGSGFTNRSSVTWTPSGSETAYLLDSSYLTATSMTAIVPAAFLAAQGTASIQVVSGDGVSSTPRTFTIGPAPATITYLSPHQATAGRTQFTLTVHGTGFVSSPQILWNGTAQTTTVVNTTSLTCTITPGMIANSGSTPVTVPVKVVNNSITTPNALDFTINPAPAITILNPASVNAGSSHATVTITGTNFTSGSTVTWTPTGSLPGAGTPTTLSSLYSSATSMTATAPSSLLTAAGTGNITVVTADFGSSNPKPFTIASDPPAVTGLTPSTATAGNTAGVTVTIAGTGFTSKSTVNWINGSGTTALTFLYSSATSLLATVPSSLLAAQGTAQIQVVNAAGSSSLTPAAPSTFTINPAPHISGLVPSAATAGSSSSVPLTIAGTNITTGSTVTWQGQTKTYTLGTSSCLTSSSSCTATVPASYLAKAGMAPITVKTADGVSSNAVSFSIASAAITGFSPNSANVGGGAFTLTVNGTGFLPGANTKVSWGTVWMSTVFVSATQLTASIPANDIPSSAGVLMVEVQNSDTPSPTVSVPVAFTISSASVPTITSVTPNSAVAGTTSAVTIIVTGANFTPGVTSGTGKTASFAAGAVIYVGGLSGTKLTPTAGTATSLTASIPTGLLTNSGALSLTVVNGSAQSNPVSSAAIPFTVYGPTLTSVSPTTIAAGSPGAVIVVTGTNFVVGTVNKTTKVYGGGSYINLCNSTGSTCSSGAMTLTAGSATSLTGTIAAASLYNVGSLYVQVQNPGGGAAVSSLYPVNIGAPTITSVSPASAAAGDAVTLTVNGTGFVSGSDQSTVYWGPDPTPVKLATTYVAATSKAPAHLTASVTTTQTAAAGTYSFRVRNGDAVNGYTDSSQNTFSINAPIISSLSPASVAPNGAAFTLTVNGTNFVKTPTPTVTMSSSTTALVATWVSATQLTAKVLATDIPATPGPVTVTVQNGTATPAPTATFNIGLVVPNTASAGSADLVISVNGSGFKTGTSVATWTAGSTPTPLTTVFVSATQVTATVPHAQLTSAGTATITVKTGTTVYTPNPNTFTINAPTVTMLSASSAVAGSAPFTLTVTGTNFVGPGGSGTPSPSTVLWNGAPLGTTTYIDASHISAPVTSTQLAVAGAVPVTVQNGT